MIIRRYLSPVLVDHRKSLGNSLTIDTTSNDEMRNNSSSSTLQLNSPLNTKRSLMDAEEDDDNPFVVLHHRGNSVQIRQSFSQEEVAQTMPRGDTESKSDGLNSESWQYRSFRLSKEDSFGDFLPGASSHQTVPVSISLSALDTPAKQPPTVRAHHHKRALSSPAYEEILRKATSTQQAMKMERGIETDQTWIGCEVSVTPQDNAGNTKSRRRRSRSITSTDRLHTKSSSSSRHRRSMSSSHRRRSSSRHHSDDRSHSTRSTRSIPLPVTQEHYSSRSAQYNREGKLELNSSVGVHDVPPPFLPQRYTRSLPEMEDEYYGAARSSPLPAVSFRGITEIYERAHLRATASRGRASVGSDRELGKDSEFDNEEQIQQQHHRSKSTAKKKKKKKSSKSDKHQKGEQTTKQKKKRRDDSKIRGDDIAGLVAGMEAMEAATKTGSTKHVVVEADRKSLVSETQSLPLHMLRQRTLQDQLGMVRWLLEEHESRFDAEQFLRDYPPANFSSEATGNGSFSLLAAMDDAKAILQKDSDS